MPFLTPLVWCNEVHSGIELRSASTGTDRQRRIPFSYRYSDKSLKWNSTIFDTDVFQMHWPIVELYITDLVCHFSDYEESQVDSTSPLFRPAPIVQINVSKNAPVQNAVFEVNKPLKGSAFQAVVSNYIFHHINAVLSLVRLLLH